MPYGVSQTTSRPTAVGEAYLAAADVERILGNTSAEREHLTAAQELFAAKGNVVEVAQGEPAASAIWLPMADSILRGSIFLPAGG